jgi:hypothetical protein
MWSLLFENVMDVCRYSARKRKGGKELRKENQRAIKPRSWLQSMEEHIWPPPLLSL